MKKKFLALGTCAFALALGLVACGDDSGSNSVTNGVKGEVITLADGSGEKVCDEKLEGWVAEAVGKDFRRCQNGEWTKITASEASAEDEIIGGVTVLRSSSSSVIPSTSSSVIPGTSSSVIPGSSSSVIPSEVDGSSSSSKANWAYLNPDIDYGEFADERDGQAYKTVTIGTQTWMAQNLNYDPGNVSSMGSYAWSGCYSNNADSCAKYGRLYTWEVAMNDASCAYGNSCHPSGTVQGVCPSGWHLPTKEEWQQLVKPMAYSVDDYTTHWDYNGAGVELKTVDGWSYYPNTTAGTNASGFSALPAGSMYSAGNFRNSGSYANFWSASESNVLSANSLDLYYGSDDAYLDYHYKNNALSVRCVQN